MSRISQIANAVATGQRSDVEKNSTTARRDHPFNVMPPRVRHASGSGRRNIPFNLRCRRSGRVARASGSLLGRNWAMPRALAYSVVVTISTALCWSITSPRTASIRPSTKIPYLSKSWLTRAFWSPPTRLDDAPSGLPQFDGPGVTIFVDCLPAFIGLAFFQRYRFCTDGASWKPTVGGHRHLCKGNIESTVA